MLVSAVQWIELYSRIDICINYIYIIYIYIPSFFDLPSTWGEWFYGFKTKASEAALFTPLLISPTNIYWVYYTLYVLLDAGDREMSFYVYLLTNDNLSFPQGAVYFL